MKINLLHAFGVLSIAGCLLVSCHADVDLRNVDTTSEVSMGLSLPVGSFKMSISDFFNADSIPDMYLETVDGEHNVLTLKKSFEYKAAFHDVNLKDKISSGVFDLKMYERIAGLGIIAPDGYVHGVGVPLTIDFPLTLKLNGINNDVSDERLDSAWIEMASFVSKITQRNMDDLLWSYVDSINLDLGQYIFRPKGKRMVVYQKNPMGSFVTKYGVPLQTDVDNFTLSMMKDPNLKSTDPADYHNNVADECVFHIYITLNIPSGQRVYVDPDAAFVYDLSVRFIDYTAIWGMYAPSGEVTGAKDTIDLSNVWDSIPFLANAKLPFANPTISASVGTYLAGALIMKCNDLFTTDKDGNKHQALFNGTTHDFVKKFNQPGEFLDPAAGTIGDSVTMGVVFDNTPQGGEIVRLFDRTPYKIGYHFSFDFDQYTTPQIRIIPNTNVRFAADVHLPMAFDKGLSIQHTDTAKDVDISHISIDSLFRQDGGLIIDSLKNTTNIKIKLKAESTIPCRIKAVIRLMEMKIVNNDTTYVVLNDSVTGAPLSLFDGDTILVTPPSVTKSGDTWIYTPKESLVTATLTKDKLYQFPKAKAILYSLYLDTNELDDAYKLDGFSAKLMTQEYVKFNISLQSQLDAIVHFNTNNNNNQ